MMLNDPVIFSAQLWEFLLVGVLVLAVVVMAVIYIRRLERGRNEDRAAAIESEPIDDIEMYIGKGNLFWEVQSGDKNVVYIRNKDLRTDFEVIRENEEE